MQILHLRNEKRKKEQETYLLKKLGHLEVTSEPIGATVHLNGEVIGTTPLIPTSPLDPGKHEVELTREGYETYRQQVTVSPGANLQLRIDMQIEQGTVEILCPQDATLKLDNQQDEECPFVGILPAGTHRLSLEGTGDQTIQRSFVLRPKERLLLDLSATGEKTHDLGRSKRDTALFAVGLVSTTLAAGAGVLGGYFIVQGDKAYDDGLLAIKNGDKAQYDEISKTLPGYREAATVSFVTCGVLLTTGITLILLSKRKSERMAETVAKFQFGLDNFKIQF